MRVIEEPRDVADELTVVDPVRRYATLTFVRGALISLAVVLVAGFLAVLHYIPAVSTAFSRIGLGFTSLRPIHTTFASAWIFLGGIAVVHRYLQDHAGPVSNGDRWRLRAQVGLWAVAGAGILLTLMLGVSSGREYMGFHPLFSIAILLGWLLFAWNFFRATWRGFWSRPVYVTMWGVAVLFFIYTFIEQHTWLLPGVFEQPIVDLRIQWKATGTLVGSFNLFVYGSLYYIGERISGDDRYAHSKLAYALFAVGLLNSFTNFGHHTYHIPQSETVKWISFIVSMTEIILLARVVWDITSMVSKRTADRSNQVHFFLAATKWWTCAMLLTAIVISVPSWNSLIHGTLVVTAHAMGTEIGIDSMALFAAISWILAEVLMNRTGADAALHSTSMRRLSLGLNISVAALVVWLTVAGAVTGYTRYQLLAPPDWLRACNPYVFASAGLATAFFLALLVGSWIRIAFTRDSAPPT